MRCALWSPRRSIRSHRVPCASSKSLTLGPAPALGSWVEVHPRQPGEPATRLGAETSWRVVARALGGGGRSANVVLLTWPSWWEVPNAPSRRVFVVLHYVDVFGNHWETAVELGMVPNSDQAGREDPVFCRAVLAPRPDG